MVECTDAERTAECLKRAPLPEAPADMNTMGRILWHLKWRAIAEGELEEWRMSGAPLQPVAR